MHYNCTMEWIYLSPHLDDVALSCGGLVWQQVQVGEQVQVWTICAGEPPPGPLSMFAQVLQARWELTEGSAVAARRREDAHAMQVLGATFHHFSIPDAVYRRHPKTNDFLYPSWEDVVNGIAPGEEFLVDRLVINLAEKLSRDAVFVVPLTLGNHIDHLLTRVAAEQLPLQVKYYPDFPYVDECAAEIPNLIPEGFQRKVYPITEQGLAAWQDSVAAYASQLSSFWTSEGQMRANIAQHCEKFGGVALWESGV